MTLALAPPPISNSPIARLDPRWKLAAALVSIVVIAALRTLPPLAVGILGALLLASTARLPLRWFLKRLGMLGISLIPFIVLMPVFQGWDGLRAATLLSLKAMTILILVLVVLGSTSLPTLAHSARMMGAPGTLIHILILGYRYIFVLADETDRLRRALRVRGFRPHTDRHTYKTVAHVIGTLLVRGGDRADRVAQAMRCRGFDGRFRSLTVFRTTTSDVAYCVGTLIGAIGLLAWDWWAA